MRGYVLRGRSHIQATIVKPGVFVRYRTKGTVHRPDCAWLDAPVSQMIVMTYDEAVEFIRTSSYTEDARGCRTCKPDGLPERTPSRGRRFRSHTGWPG